MRRPGRGPGRSTRRAGRSVERSVAISRLHWSPALLTDVVDAIAGSAVETAEAMLTSLAPRAVGTAAIGGALVVVRSAIFAMAVAEEISKAEIPVRALVGPARLQHAVGIGKIDQPVAIVVDAVKTEALIWLAS